MAMLLRPPLLTAGAIALTVWAPPAMTGAQPSSVGAAPDSPISITLLRVALLVGVALFTTRKLRSKRPPTATKPEESHATVFTVAAGSTQAEVPEGTPMQTPALQLVRGTEVS